MVSRVEESKWQREWEIISSKEYFKVQACITWKKESEEEAMMVVYKYTKS